MPNLRPLLSCLLALAIPACLPADDDPATSEAVGELGIGTAGHWSTLQAAFGATIQTAQVGSINGRTFAIRAGSCDSWVCFAGYNINSLDSYEYVGTNFGNTPRSIPSESSLNQVSLAAFNGYLYMAHTGGNDDQGTTYLSHLDLATNIWTPDYALSTTTIPSNYGAPALVPLNGKLYFIGTRNYAPYQMWAVAMDANENFANPMDIPGHQTTGRISATVAFGQIFFAHRDGTSTNLVYGTSTNGTAWSPVNRIYGGANNGALQGTEAAIASDGNHLHLVHTRPGDTYVWWSQFDNCNWSASESQIGGIQTQLPPALAAGGPGMIMLTEVHDQHWYNIAYAAWTPPSMPSRCLVNSP